MIHSPIRRRGRDTVQHFSTCDQIVKGDDVFRRGLGQIDRVGVIPYTIIDPAALRRSRSARRRWRWSQSPTAHRVRALVRRCRRATARRGAAREE